MPISKNISKYATKSLVLSSIFLAGTTITAQAQKNLPDSQIESNVLKALASAPELAAESITTHTVYGTVTLSGSVRDEQARRKAEDLAANAEGVTKVVDELRIGTSETTEQPVQQQTLPSQKSQDNGAPLILQSDGTYAPAPTAEPESTPNPAPAAAQRNDPEVDQELDRQREAQAGHQDGNPPADGSYTADSGAPPLSRRPQDQYPQNNPSPYPPSNYPQQSHYPQNYPQRYPQNYPQQPPYPTDRYPQQPVYGGQAAGQPVTIPSGALIRVRMNRTLSSDHSQPGTTFDAIVTNDVVADGFIAIPRGATVQGTVIDSKSSGTLKGRGEMSIQLTHVTLGGKVYPLVSDVWAHHGGDKTIETVNKTAGFGAAGAIIGAIAGGGVGAAVGGGVGAAAGLGSSAASGNGQVYIPAEGMVTFHLAQSASVETLSEGEMQRLAFGTVPGADHGPIRRRAYPPVVVGPGYPVYYPGPYGPYGPYGYPRY